MFNRKILKSSRQFILFQIRNLIWIRRILLGIKLSIKIKAILIQFIFQFGRIPTLDMITIMTSPEAIHCCSRDLLIKTKAMHFLVRILRHFLFHIYVCSLSVYATKYLLYMIHYFSNLSVVFYLYLLLN